ncbi:MAG: endonuclease/exonuclease/phosphatase family protein [Bacteriovoracaceae bacterium]|nr:endonuclease/exonuclease/phosphatase family protein [Bacteriovoracaceae bacterium]
MTLRLISSNIRFENAADESHDWPKRKTLLANTLTKFNADVIGTQEGRQPQLKDFESLLPGFELIDSHREWITERMYPTLYINSENITVNKSGDIWLSETPYEAGSSSFKSSFPRLCTWASLTTKKNNHSFFLINTHLDHVLEETRVEQIKVLLKEVKDKNTENLPVILMGDFNSSPDSEVRQEILSQWSFLHDPWHTLQLKEETSYHKFQGAYEEGTRIDWMLVDKKVKTHDIYLDKSTEEGLYPSDHFPLMGIFEL